MPSDVEEDLGRAKKAVLAPMEEPQEAVDFFRNNGKSSMLKQLEEKKRRKKEKKLREERKRSSQTVSVERADADVQESKRRRISTEDEDEDDARGIGRASSSSHRTPSPATIRSRSKRPQESPKTLSGKYSQLTGSDSRTRTSSKPTRVSVLSDSDDDRNAGRKSRREHHDENLADDDYSDGPHNEPTGVSKYNISDDDDDVAAIIAKARAIISQRSAKENEPAAAAAAAAAAAESKPVTPQLSKAELLQLKVKERLQQYKETGSIKKASSETSTPNPAPPIINTSAAPAPDPVYDPKIQIFITSTIAGTRPLIFIRKLSQTLKKVKEAWCEEQEFLTSDEQKASIFLTWKGHKMYDATTCKRMLGNRVVENKIDTQGEGFDDGKLHMEAWTKETFQVYQQEKELGRNRNNFPQDEEEEEEEPEEEVVAEPTEAKCKLILRSKGMEDFKLIVKSHTRIAKIISSFQSSRDIGEDRQISLSFDGDFLDPDSMVQDLDIQDLDVIEVQIK